MSKVSLKDHSVARLIFSIPFPLPRPIDLLFQDSCQKKIVDNIFLTLVSLAAFVNSRILF